MDVGCWPSQGMAKGGAAPSSSSLPVVNREYYVETYVDVSFVNTKMNTAYSPFAKCAGKTEEGEEWRGG
jgi:hypothetical protein